ncbi:MAG: hypothetical protein C0169_04975 [Thermodesulfobacterium geofontis]|nr:MAG: hypothetical protein C0169_04975 [Thermodesulfobacterium geofontis]
MEEKDGICSVKEELKKVLFENFEKFAKSEWYLEKELLTSFLNFVIKKLEDEFKYIDLEEPPDPKYQTLILIDLTS